jgi:hypothetical protein
VAIRYIGRPQEVIVVDLERLKARAAEIAEEESGKLLSTTP